MWRRFLTILKERNQELLELTKGKRQFEESDIWWNEKQVKSRKQ